MIAMAKSSAFLKGRSYVLPSDVHNIIGDTIGHRIILSQGAHMRNVSEFEVIKKVLGNIPVPEINQEK